MSSAAGRRRVGARVLALWTDLRRRRRTAAAVGRHLRPGLYRPLSGTLWARRGARLPAHLRRTKAASRPGPAGDSRTFRLFRLVGGAFVVLGPSRGRTAELVVVSFDGGIVILDQAGGRVLRTYGTGPVTLAGERRRRRFTDHVSAPRFEIRGGGTMIEEELVEGDFLGDLTEERRGALLTTLVEQFAALTSAGGGEAPSVTDRDLEDLLAQIVVPPGLARAWADSSTRWFSPETPWIPTPREANAKNIVVRPDGRPAPIDLGDLQVDPYLVYPVGILIAAGDEVMRRFLSAEADFSFPVLLAAAGRPWAGTPGERRGLLLARIVYAARKDACAEGVVDLNAFAASLQRRWDEVRGAFAGIAPAP